ncbi:MAG: hypothetical protein ACREUZ_11615 [Burkholderiales bacterium]
MPQLTLFDSSEKLLADDERGRIAYTPRFVDRDTAEAWFAELRSGVAWRSAASASEQLCAPISSKQWTRRKPAR